MSKSQPSRMWLLLYWPALSEQIKRGHRARKLYSQAAHQDHAWFKYQGRYMGPMCERLGANGLYAGIAGLIDAPLNNITCQECNDLAARAREAGVFTFRGITYEQTPENEKS